MTTRQSALEALDRLDMIVIDNWGRPSVDEIAIIRAALLKSESAWMPIESAPRDGTNILLCVAGEDVGYKTGSVARIIGHYAPKFTLPISDDVYDADKYPKLFDYHEPSGEYYAVEGFYTACFENSYGDEIVKPVRATHWQPLPLPPKQENK